MQFTCRAVLAVVTAGVVVFVVSGCGMSESRKVEVVALREVQRPRSGAVALSS